MTLGKSDITVIIISLMNLVCSHEKNDGHLDVVDGITDYKEFSVYYYYYSHAVCHSCIPPPHSFFLTRVAAIIFHDTLVGSSLDWWPCG